MYGSSQQQREEKELNGLDGFSPDKFRRRQGDQKDQERQVAQSRPAIFKFSVSRHVLAEY